MREPVKEWLNDLRSGQFNQTTKVLRRIDDLGTSSYCCLGVAVETYKRVTGKTPMLVASEHVGSEETLEQFPEVQAWLGLKSIMGEAPCSLTDLDRDLTSLTQLNDRANFSFKEIADIIEQKKEDLFYD